MTVLRMIPVVVVATATPMLGPAPEGETHRAIKMEMFLVGTPGGDLLPTEGGTLAVVAAEAVTPTMVTTETDETIAAVAAATLTMTTLMTMMMGTMSPHRRRPPLKLLETKK